MQSKLAIWLRLRYETGRSYSFIEVDRSCVLRGVTQGLVQVGSVGAFLVGGSLAWLLAVGLFILELAQIVHLVHLVQLLQALNRIHSLHLHLVLLLLLLILLVCR